MQRYNNYMCLDFIQRASNTQGTLAKKELVKKFYNDYGDCFIEFLKDTMSPYIVFNVSKETINNYKDYIKDDLRYEYSSISELVDFMTGKTGNDAVKISVCSFLSSFDYDEDEFDYVSRILLRNLRIGIDIKNVNSALGFEAIESFAVQLCEPFEREHTDPLIHEPKLDGVRCTTIIDEYFTVKMFTRNGKLLEGYDSIKESLISCMKEMCEEKAIVFGGMVFDGEIFDKDFDGTMNNLFRKSSQKKGTYYIFDCLQYDEFKNKSCTTPLSQRKTNMEIILLANIIKLSIENIQIVEYRNFSFRDNVSELMNFYISKGYEGMIVKRLNSLYQFRRTYDWQKIKPFETIDLAIDEIVEGTGKYLGMMGSVYVIHQGVRVKVGSGFSDEQRKDIWNNPSDYLGEFIEIQYQDITKDKSLRFPSFKRMRYDK